MTVSGPTLISVAASNLAKSHEFLKKLIDVCQQLHASPNSDSDREMLATVKYLADLTATVVRTAEAARRDGTVFLARNLSISAAPAAADPGQPEGQAGRMRVVMDMCLRQADQHRQRAATLEGEVASLRQSLKRLEQDLLEARTALTATVPGRHANARR